MYYNVDFFYTLAKPFLYFHAVYYIVGTLWPKVIFCLTVLIIVRVLLWHS